MGKLCDYGIPSGLPSLLAITNNAETNTNYLAGCIDMSASEFKNLYLDVYKKIIKDVKLNTLMFNSTNVSIFQVCFMRNEKEANEYGHMKKKVKWDSIFILNPSIIFSNIEQMFNLPSNIISVVELKKEFINCKHRLFDIKSMADFNAFPLLKNKYESYMNYYRAYLDSKNSGNLEYFSTNNKEVVDYIKYFNFYPDKCNSFLALDNAKSIQLFIKQYINKVQGFFNEFADDKTLNSVFLKDMIDLSQCSDFNRKALELSVACKKMVDIITSKRDDKLFQENIYYVAGYLNSLTKEDFEQRIDFNFDFSNMEERLVSVTPNDLYQAFNKYVSENQDVYYKPYRLSDFDGFDWDQSRNKVYKEQERDIILNRNFLVASEANVLKNIEETIARKESLSLDDKARAIANIRKLYDEKVSLYEMNVKPKMRIFGINLYEGYIGFVYPNGWIILDKLCEPDGNIKYSSAVPVYYTNFDKVTLMSPSELIESGYKRIIHNGNWQDKVKDFSERDTGLLPFEFDEFVRELKLKK